MLGFAKKLKKASPYGVKVLRSNDYLPDCDRVIVDVLNNGKWESHVLDYHWAIDGKYLRMRDLREVMGLGSAHRNHMVITFMWTDTGNQYIYTNKKTSFEETLGKKSEFEFELRYMANDLAYRKGENGNGD